MTSTWFVGPLVIIEEGKGYRVTRGERSARMSPTLLRILVFITNHPDEGLALEQIVNGLRPANALSESSVRLHISEIRRVMVEVGWKVEFGRRLYWSGKKYTWSPHPRDPVTPPQPLPALDEVPRGAIRESERLEDADDTQVRGLSEKKQQLVLPEFGTLTDPSLPKGEKVIMNLFAVGDRVRTIRPIPNFTWDTLLPRDSGGVVVALLHDTKWVQVAFPDTVLTTTLAGVRKRRKFAPWMSYVSVSALRLVSAHTA